MSGGDQILSWAAFHRTRLPGYPAPYNVVAVRTDEGPIFISNLVQDPEADVVGRRVRLEVVRMADGASLPRFGLV